MFEQAGWLIWPIFLCSLIAMGIVLERLYTLRRSAIAPKQVVGQVADIAQASAMEAGNLQRQGLLGELLSGALLAGADPARRETYLRQESGRIAFLLERNLETLGVIAAVAPLLGLLGTVVGMIDVFGALMVHGAGDASVLAGGIGQALVTTAAGLTVAIPALVAHRLLLRRVRGLMVELEQACDKFLLASPGLMKQARAA